MTYDYEEITIEKDKRRSLRRKNDFAKAIRKRNISKSRYGLDWYDNLHAYSKNKIHCSCGMCRFKSVWEPNTKTHSDKMREEEMRSRLIEYGSA